VTDTELRGTRLKAFCKALKIKQNVLAQRIGVSPGFVSRVITGQEEMTGKVLFKLSENFEQLNIDWLLKGDGEMFLGGLEKKYEELPDSGGVVSEADGEYGRGDPLSALREVLDGYGRRIAALEAEVEALRKDVKKT